MPREATLRHLAGLYAASPDPWGHLSRPYERAKYHETLRAVGPGPFEEAVEVGCGNGALSDLLAPRCRRLRALDAVPGALALARARLARHPQVEVARAVAPQGLPDAAPDLVLLSEVLYFLRPEEVDALAAWIARRARPGARVVAVNWAGPTGEPLSGLAAADRLRAALPWPGLRRTREGYAIDVLARP